MDGWTGGRAVQLRYLLFHLPLTTESVTQFSLIPLYRHITRLSFSNYSSISISSTTWSSSTVLFIFFFCRCSLNPFANQKAIAVTVYYQFVLFFFCFSSFGLPCLPSFHSKLHQINKHLSLLPPPLHHPSYR